MEPEALQPRVWIADSLNPLQRVNKGNQVGLILRRKSNEIGDDLGRFSAMRLDGIIT